MLTINEFHEVLGAIKHIQRDKLTNYAEIETVLLRYTKRPDGHAVGRKIKLKKFKCVDCGDRFDDDSHLDDDEDDDVCLDCYGSKDEDGDEDDDDLSITHCDVCGSRLDNLNQGCKHCLTPQQLAAIGKSEKKEKRKGLRAET